MAITIHLEVCGEPLSLLLDIAKVAQSHLGMALAEEFAQILTEFSVEHKVSTVLIWILWDSYV
jgi:hypothetical protein